MSKHIGTCCVQDNVEQAGSTCIQHLAGSRPLAGRCMSAVHVGVGLATCCSGLQACKRNKRVPHFSWGTCHKPAVCTHASAKAPPCTPSCHTRMMAHLECHEHTTTNSCAPHSTPRHPERHQNKLLRARACAGVRVGVAQCGKQAALPG